MEFQGIYKLHGGPKKSTEVHGVYRFHRTPWNSMEFFFFFSQWNSMEYFLLIKFNRLSIKSKNILFLY
jgi:hypothetical protein